MTYRAPADFLAAVQTQVDRFMFDGLVARNTSREGSRSYGMAPDPSRVLDLRDSAEARTPRPVNNSAT